MSVGTSVDNQNPSPAQRSLLAERQLAAAMLDDQSALCILAIDLLQPSDFAQTIPRLIFSAYAQLARLGAPLGSIPVAAELANSDDLQQAGGLSTLYEFEQDNWASPQPTAISYWVKQIKEGKNRRNALNSFADAGKILHLGKLDDAADALRELSRSVDIGINDQDDYWGDWNDDSDLLREQWIIRDLLPAEGSLMIRSEKNGGKSLFALTLAAHIASGNDQFAERSIRTDRCSVVYLDGESSFTIAQQRIAALMISENFNNTQRQSVYDNLRYRVVRSKTMLTGLVDEVVKSVRDTDIALVIVDTWSRLAGLESENDNAEAIRAFAEIERLGDELGCPVIILSHPTKNARAIGSGYTTRGASGADDQAFTTANIKADRDNGTASFKLDHTRGVHNRGIELQWSVIPQVLGKSPRGETVDASAITDLQWLSAKDAKTERAKAASDVASDARAETMLRRLDQISESLADGPMKTADLAKEIGVKPGTLRQWRKRYESEFLERGITVESGVWGQP